jgi:hypothetical protein
MIPVTVHGRQQAEAERIAALKAGSAYGTEGPGHPVMPGEIAAGDFTRPYLTEGHSAPSPDHVEHQHVDFTQSQAVGVLIPADVQADMGPAGGGR